MTDGKSIRPATRQAVARKTASQPGRVTGKLRVACVRIIEFGEELDEAAKAAGLTTRTVRLALEKPHVIAWMKRQREVFRAAVSAQNIHHAKRMRDSSTNEMAKLGAMKLIEQIGDDTPPGAAIPTQPGLVIVVMPSPAHPAPQPKTIEHDPDVGEKHG